ncbi:MAG: efflux RND transporter permease subunit, partial [Vicinamibacteria bacterium]
TSLGFFCLLLANLDAVREMGLVMGTGILLAFAVNFLLTPIALSIFPIPRRGLHLQRDSGFAGGLIRWAVRLTHRRTPAILAVSALLVIGSVAMIPRLEIGMRILDEIPSKDSVSVALHEFEKHLMGTEGADVSIRAPYPGAFKEPVVLERMARLEDMIRQQPAVRKTWSIVDLLQEMQRAMGEDGRSPVPQSPEAVAQYLLLYSLSDGNQVIDGLVNGDESWARIEFRGPDYGTASFLEVREAIEKRGRELFPPPFEVAVLGDGLIAAVGVQNIIMDLLQPFGMAFLLIALTMVVALRSVRLGLIAMIPNNLPMLLALGLLALFGFNIRVGTAIVFTMALGIACDDTIHVLVRYTHERARGLSPEAAIEESLFSSGRAIVFTSLVLILGFQALFASDF